jgi:23S rRNA (guanine745-N1)-methyltransferase
MSVLKCPVCNLELVRNVNTYSCYNHHSYDIAKKGYTNLLLANQGHALNSGDDKEMVEARVRFLQTDHYKILQSEIVNQFYKHLLNKEQINFGDIACGEGYYTSYIHEQLYKDHDIHTHGVDISKFAIVEACSKKKVMNLQNIDYFIGNMDYLPFMNQSFDILLNCFAPMNEKEFSRVLKENGIYIRVLPGSKHLLGLKEVLYEEVYLNLMKGTQLDQFELIDEVEINDVISLSSAQQIWDLFMMTPYYYKTSIESANKLKSLSTLKTIISFVLLVYRKK